MSLNLKYKKIIEILKKDGIGVMPTDTIYGLVGSAFSKKAVEKIFKIKKRDGSKPLIVLISSISDLKKFGINKKFPIIKKVWPGKVSVILPCTSSKFKYLHRGTKSIAFRFPNKKSLIEILKSTGPLVAPSANPEGQKPAQTISEAKKYFYPVRNREGLQRVPISNGVENSIDFYLSGGVLRSKPSTLIKINNNDDVEVLRGVLK